MEDVRNDIPSKRKLQQIKQKEHKNEQCQIVMPSSIGDEHNENERKPAIK